MKLGAVLALGALLVMAAAGNAAAHGCQGGIRGTVKDLNGVTPGAEVTVTNEATNIKRTTTTNEAGEYNFPNLEPGAYTVRAALQGFKTTEKPGIRVGTQTFIVLDMLLEVGALEESITVT